MPKRLLKSSKAAAASSSSAPTPSALPSSVPASLTDPELPLPKLVVFDLDYTLWPFWVDTHVSPPLRALPGHTQATDRTGEGFAFYEDVPAILLALPALGVRLAVASRTTADALARDLLKMLRLDADFSSASSSASNEAGDDDKTAMKRPAAWDVFDAGFEAYNRDKRNHFKAIQARTGIAFEDMLFFDDESRNLKTEELGVTMQLVRDGVTWNEFERGVKEWRKRRGYANGS
jgi:magnesium-dependent phosphatase 1